MECNSVIPHHRFCINQPPLALLWGEWLCGLIDEPSRVQQVGKYYDVFERENGSLLIKDRKCVYDTVVIDNCLVFPV